MATTSSTNTTQSTVTPSSPLVEHLIGELRTYERVALVTSRHFDATMGVEREHARHTANQYEAQRATIAARAELATSLHAVYQSPSDALHRFELDAEIRGRHAALETLTSYPPRYGTLRREPQQGWHRIVPTRAAEEPARQAAHRAAVAAVTLFERQSAERVAPMSPTSLTEAMRAAERYAVELRTLPERAILERSIGNTIRQLDPTQLKAAEQQLTSAQTALLRTFRASVREVALGTELER